MIRRQCKLGTPTWTAGLLLSSAILSACGGRVIATSGPGLDDGVGGSSGGGSSASSSATTGTTQGAAVVTTSTVSTSTTGTVFSVEIPFSDGWAPRELNQFGIQGAFWVATDLGGSVAAGSFDDVSCIRGVVSRVPVGAGGMPDFGYYWGAMLGFDLNQAESGDALPYDAKAHGVVGFGFVVAGANPVPAGGELRINVKVYGDDAIYCNRVLSSGPTTYTFDSIRRSCWENDPAAPTPDPSRIESLQWQYATNATFGYDFDLCIAQLWVLPS